METKGSTTRAQKTRRGNEMRCAADAAGGLFDIVKNDEGRAGRTQPGLRFCNQGYKRPGLRESWIQETRIELDQLSARTTGPRRG